MNNIAILGDPFEYFSERQCLEIYADISRLMTVRSPLEIRFIFPTSPQASASTFAKSQADRLGYDSESVAVRNNDYIEMVKDVVKRADEMYVYRTRKFAKFGNEHGAALFAKRMWEEGRPDLVLRMTQYEGGFDRTETPPEETNAEATVVLETADYNATVNEIFVEA